MQQTIQDKRFIKINLPNKPQIIVKNYTIDEIKNNYNKYLELKQENIKIIENLLFFKKKQKFLMSDNIVMYHIKIDLINFYKNYYRLYINQLYNRKLIINVELELIKIKLKEMVNENK